MKPAMHILLNILNSYQEWTLDIVCECREESPVMIYTCDKEILLFVQDDGNRVVNLWYLHV